MILEKYKSIKTKKVGKDKYRYCLDCDWEEDEWRIEHPALNKNNRIDVKMVKEYCNDHLRLYSHESCKPVWCSGCGNLEKYTVVVGKGKNVKRQK